MSMLPNRINGLTSLRATSQCGDGTTCGGAQRSILGSCAGYFRSLRPIGSSTFQRRGASCFAASIRDPLKVTPSQLMRLTSHRPVAYSGSMGNRPLIVLRHGRQSTMLAAVWEDGWPSAQMRLAAMSTRGQIIVVPDTGHAIAGENPAAVAAAVESVVGDIRRLSSPTTSTTASTP